MEIHGTCKPGFTAVRDAFEANFEAGREIGASAAMTVDGEFVVDIWGGDRYPDGGPWQRDTIVNVYSTTKTMAATCLLMLADRGELDFDAPVAQYWPEFAQNGKEGVLVRHVMSHTAGLSGFDPPVDVTDLYDLDGIAAHLAAQAPWWEPGTASGYHMISQGNLTGEILYRVTGRRMAEWFRTEVAEPLGADFWMSVPESEDPRVSDLKPPESLDGMIPEGAEPALDSIAVRTFLSCHRAADSHTTREWRAAELPASGGFGNARSVARIHSALVCGGEVDGVRLLSEAGARRALEEQVDNIDLVLMMRLRHGLGFGLQIGDETFGPSSDHMFWGGLGGSLCVLDFDSRMSVAYVMNRMAAEPLGDVRGRSIIEAAYASL